MCVQYVYVICSVSLFVKENIKRQQNKGDKEMTLLNFTNL